MSAGGALAARQAELAGRLAGMGPAVAAWGRVVAARGPLATVEGLAVPAGARLEIEGHGPAEALAWEGGRLTALIASDARPAPGARVQLAAHGDAATVGPGLWGRVIGADGAPLDGLGPVASGGSWPLDGRRVPPLDRAEVTEPMATGVRAIDALFTLGRGQRIGLMAGSGVGKSVLMRMLAAHAAADRVVIALIGERGREIAGFVTGLGREARARTLVVAAPADAPAAARLRAARLAMAVAEAGRAEGQHVLLMIDSLTRVAQAGRDLALLAGEAAGVRGWPASALGLIAPLVERAGNDARTSGAVTAVMTVLADGDDLVADPVVDTARGVLDGHVMLSRAMAERGIWPAIDAAASLSRTMPATVPPAVLKAASAFRRDWALAEANRDLVAMGAHAPGHDLALDRALGRRAAMEAMIAQGPDVAVTMAEAHARLIETWGSDAEGGA